MVNLYLVGRSGLYGCNWGLEIVYETWFHLFP